MAFENEKLSELLLKLNNLENQVKRIISDIESEKGTRLRIHTSFDNQIKELLKQISDVKHELYKKIDELNAWKNTVVGSLAVIKILITIVCSVAAGLILYILTKK